MPSDQGWHLEFRSPNFSESMANRGANDAARAPLQLCRWKFLRAGPVRAKKSTFYSQGAVSIPPVEMDHQEFTSLTVIMNVILTDRSDRPQKPLLIDRLALRI